MNGISLLEAVTGKTGKTGENHAPPLISFLSTFVYMCHLILLIYLLNSNPTFNKIPFVRACFKKKIDDPAVIVR